jgi:hypothetical protein
MDEGEKGNSKMTTIFAIKSGQKTSITNMSNLALSILQ